MAKKHVYRVGDKVRVLRDRFIDRVGYSLHWQMLMDEVENDPRVHDALHALGLSGLLGAPRYFLIAVAKMHVESRNFGGRERAIHYHEPGGFARWEGSRLTVNRKRVVKTGRYFPPYSYGEDYDGDPGGLEDCKTHIILTTDAGDIEACDVEPWA